MEIIKTELAGVHVIRPRIFKDARGSFVKTFHAGWFREQGMDFEPCEEFFSTSAKNVLRGMHFQLPPAAHAKLVYCIAGRALDVVLDIRKNSSTFGCCHAREINDRNREIVFIPVGFAHGFLALEDGATMVYQTSTVHSPAQDAGIVWNSFGFGWPVTNPVVSDRDRTFPALKDFQSPF
jgi:dTDP-4-dehydrorhamnose 3,5-epimerase